jgi:cytochrome b561
MSPTSISGTALRYDSKTMYLHWVTAALVILLWGLGQTIDWFPRGVPRVAARSTHIVAGTLLAIVLIQRIWWRITSGSRLPAEGTKLIRQASTLVHWALYVSVLATVALGFANAWVRGDNIFNLFSIPAFDPGNKALRHTVEDLHGLAANTVIILAGLHAAAALVHHYVWKDNVLRRMLPGHRSAS